MATPLYDALVSEYRQALRCVPGEYRVDGRSAVEACAVPAPVITAQVSGFQHHFDGLAYARRAPGVPRQVSRHRGTAEDGDD